MVQEKIAPPAFEIVDETPAEQVAVEEKVLAGQTVPDAPEEETPEPVPAVAQAPAPEPKPEPKVEVPQPRTYTEEQVRQMQSSWDRQIAQERQKAIEHQQRLQQFDLAAQVEAHLRQQERQLEPTMGAEEARRQVRNPDNEAQVKEFIGNRQQVRALQEQQRAAVAEQELQAKVITARLLAQEHGVPAEKMKLLLAVGDPEAMSELARDIGSKVKATAAVRAQVPVETPKTALESGISGTSAPESADRMMERLNNTPSWEWTEQDRRFMRTGRV